MIQSREGLVYRVTQDGEQVNEFANKNNEYPCLPRSRRAAARSAEWGLRLGNYLVYREE